MLQQTSVPHIFFHFKLHSTNNYDFLGPIFSSSRLDIHLEGEVNLYFTDSYLHHPSIQGCTIGLIVKTQDGPPTHRPLMKVIIVREERGLVIVLVVQILVGHSSLNPPPPKDHPLS